MSKTVRFTHRNVEINGETRQDKINSYIQLMGGPQALLDYFLMNLKIINEDFTEIKIEE